VHGLKNGGLLPGIYAGRAFNGVSTDNRSQVKYKDEFITNA